MRKKQVEKSLYFTDTKYDHKGRWLSYYYQIKNIIGYGGRILEIGVGNSFTSNYLKLRGYDIKTLDIDQDLDPDYVGDVVKMPFANDSFDSILCCETLEHIPFNEFEVALKEMKRVAKNIVLSLPDHRRIIFSLSFKLPFLNEINFNVKVHSFKNHEFDGHHYWEIGKNGYSLSKIKKVIKNLGFNIKSDFTPTDCPMIHFFILEKLK